MGRVEKSKLLCSVQILELIFVFYDLFCTLCKQKNVSPTRAALEIGLSKSTATKWKNSGATPNGETLAKIADYFDVSTDYLLSDGETGDNKKAASDLSRKDERDIEKIIAETRRQLENQDGLMFDGNPASPEAIESILSAMELGLQAAKMRNKEKYTPKKYRK